jgi:hypothetical protein
MLPETSFTWKRISLRQAKFANRVEIYIAGHVWVFAFREEYKLFV